MWYSHRAQSTDSARAIVSRFLESSGESGKLPSNQNCVRAEAESNKLLRLLQGVPPEAYTHTHNITASAQDAFFFLNGWWTCPTSHAGLSFIPNANPNISQCIMTSASAQSSVTDCDFPPLHGECSSLNLSWPFQWRISLWWHKVHTRAASKWWTIHSVGNGREIAPHA